jgi:ankyrin repeat protein
MTVALAAALLVMHAGRCTPYNPVRSTPFLVASLTRPAVRYRTAAMTYWPKTSLRVAAAMRGWVDMPSAILFQVSPMRYGPTILLLAATLLFAGPPGLADDGQELQTAVRAGDAARVSQLLAGDVAAVNAADRDGETLLHLAVQQFDPAMVELLLSKGAAVNAKNNRGETPLYVLAAAGTNEKPSVGDREKLTTALLGGGADRLLADAAGVTALHVAALKGRAGMVRLLVADKTDANVRDDAGRAALHYAAQGNHLKVIDVLVERGAEVNAADQQGNTPLHAAAARFRSEAAERLLALGAKVNAANAAGDTPLHVAASAGPSEKEVDAQLVRVAEVLLKRGADAKIKNKAGATPLKLAQAKEHTGLAALLQRQEGR